MCTYVGVTLHTNYEGVLYRHVHIRMRESENERPNLELYYRSRCVSGSEAVHPCAVCEYMGIIHIPSCSLVSAVWPRRGLSTRKQDYLQTSLPRGEWGVCTLLGQVS